MLPSQFTHSLKTSSPIRSNYWGHYMKPTQTRHKENLSNLPSFFHSLIPQNTPSLQKKKHMASWNIPILNTRDTSSFMVVVLFHLSCYTPRKGNMSTKKRTISVYILHLNQPSIQLFRWTFPGWWLQPI